MKQKKNITKNYSNINSLGGQEQAYIFGLLRNEVNYRRDKAWKIFSWASTILVALGGSYIALASNLDPKKTISIPFVPHKLFLISSIIILSTYSILWIDRNLTAEEEVLEELRIYEIESGLRLDISETKKSIFARIREYFGYRITVILLTLANLMSIILLG